MDSWQRDAAARKRKKSGQETDHLSSSSLQPSLPFGSSSATSSFSFTPQPPHSRFAWQSHSAEQQQDRPHATFSSNWNTPVIQQLGRSLYGVVCYAWDLVMGTLFILRPLFSFLLALVVITLLLAALTRSLNVFRSEVQTRIVCKIPLVSHIMRCPPPSYVETDPMMIHVPNFADLVNKQAASYELIVDSLSSLNPDMIPKMKNKFKGQGRGFFGGRKGKGTVVNDQNGQGGAVLSSGHSDGGDTHGEDEDDPYGLAVHTQSHGLPLPLLLKRAELAVVDLKVLVRHSTLPEEAKQLLVEQLQLFHTRAKLTSRQLQFLQARANGCVDGLVIRNVYLMLELDRLEAQQELMKQGKGTGGMWDKMLYFFSGTHDLQVATSEYKLQHLYQTTMEDARNHVRDLIVQAQEVLQSLDTLDQALATIQEITTQETRQQKNAHDETLALLWSRLGGNRLERGFYRENLGLLKNLDSQRKATVGQIQAALWKLTDFEAEIGILREKIVDASVDATRDEGPLRVKAPSFEGQSDAGAGGGLGASSLRAHIQQIDMVTSRLKDRSFLADAIVKAQADKIPNMPGLTDDTASSESSP